MFASGDLAAFDFAGQQIWSRAFGVLKNPYGHASSLTTHQHKLIVQLDQGSARDQRSKLLAIDGATGRTIWQVPRDVPASWSTPLIVEYQGEPRIITSADPWVIAYAVADGREIWRAECLSGDIGPSPVYAEGVVYVANDYSLVSAIRDGGQGDVTETHILWSASVGLPDVCSPLATDKYLLLVTSSGTLVSYDRQRGGDQPLWDVDLETTAFASPSLVGDRVYVIGEDGQGSVWRPSDTGAERVATSQLGERCLSSPAFQPGRVYLRGEHNLYCLVARPSHEPHK
jgi:outer membrane protein assembly factor BamB